MKKRNAAILITVLLLIPAALEAARVVETDDIDSFITDEDGKKSTTQEESTVSKTKISESQVKHKIFSLGIGFNFGFFVSEDITDVNSHIYQKTKAEEIENWGSSSVIRSDTLMYLSLVPRFTINIMPIRYLMIQILGEVAWGPKFVIDVMGESHTYNFMRYSPGLILNAYLPLGSTKKHSLFLGGGVLYNFLEFEGYEANSIGGRGQFGYRVDWTSLALEVFVAYDYARGESGEYNPYIGREMTLDYSSFLIGLNFYFKII
jgi:hypothetical protein